MKKENKKIIAVFIVFILVVTTLIWVISTNVHLVRYSGMYTLRGHLYKADDLGNNSYHFFFDDSSHRNWGGGSWTFPYRQGKEKFYFTDVGDENISDFIDRYIEITYRSDGVESVITDIKYTYYDSIVQAEKEDQEAECMLILEQRVACFQGCHAFVRLLHIDFLNNTELWTVTWENCIEYCERRYNVTFDENGDIENCSYCDEQ